MMGMLWVLASWWSGWAETDSMVIRDVTSTFGEAMSPCMTTAEY